MGAECTLLDNFVYEDVEMSSQAAVGGKKQDDSSEPENEHSIPQEISIAGTISIQNQRRATGSLNASNQRSKGMSRGKSTPTLNQASVHGPGGVVGQQHSKGASGGTAGSQQHPTMVGASTTLSSLKLPAAVRSSHAGLFRAGVHGRVALPPLKPPSPAGQQLRPTPAEPRRRDSPSNPRSFRPVAVGAQD